MPSAPKPAAPRVIDNLLVRIHFIIVMIRWTGLAPWEFQFPFPGSLTSPFLEVPPETMYPKPETGYPQEEAKSKRIAAARVLPETVLYPKPGTGYPEPETRNSLVRYRRGKRMFFIRVRIQILVPVASSLYWASAPDGS